MTVELQMVATTEDQKATFDPRTVRLIDPHEVDRKDSTLPFARFVEKDWMAIGDEPVPVDYKAIMQFAFEVPEDRLPMLVLSIGGKDVAPVKDLLEKSRAKVQKES